MFPPPLRPEIIPSRPRPAVLAGVACGALLVVGGAATFLFTARAVSPAAPPALEQTARLTEPPRPTPRPRSTEATAAPAASVRVSITSTPPGATVTIGGTKIGTTPLVAEIPADAPTHVTLEAPGHLPVAEELAPFPPGQEIGLSFLLARAP